MAFPRPCAQSYILKKNKEVQGKKGEEFFNANEETSTCLCLYITQVKKTTTIADLDPACKLILPVTI